jgi:hypothetical protein
MESAIGSGWSRGYRGLVIGLGEVSADIVGARVAEFFEDR